MMLHYEIYGEGETVVLLPGLLASTKYWKEIIPSISQKRKVIVIDQLGFGKSPKPDDEVEYTIDDNVLYYEKIFEQLHLQNFTLVGYSSSAIVSLRIARKFPNHVRNLLLITPPIHFSKESAVDSLNKSFRTYKYFMNGPLKFGFILFVSIFRKILSITAPLFITHVRAESAKDVFNFTWKSLYNSIENIIVKQNVLEDLKQIKAPIKILYAEEDNMVIKENLVELAKEFPNIILEKVDCTHQIPLEKPEIVIKDILN